MTFQKFAFTFSIIGIFLFLILVHWAMFTYSGGTIHDPSSEGYSFTYNFFSDLGRKNTPARIPNFPTNIIFKSAMTITGSCIVLFFFAVPGIFGKEFAKGMAVLASIFGVVAGICYLGIGWVPYDYSYGGHHMFVRVGFVSFLLMSWAYATAIFLENNYPNKYAWALLMFSLILFSQLWLLSNGERSWRSKDALFRQATAQKVVVYSEVFLMLFQTYGAKRKIKKNLNFVSKTNDGEN